MKTSKINLVRVFGIICILLMLGMFVLQFIPFWEITFEDPEDNLSVSIAEYIWFPGDNEDLTEYFEDEYKENFDEKYKISSIVLPCAMLMVLPVVAIAFFAFDTQTMVVPVMALLCGGFGTWALLAKPAMQYGGLWVVYLVLSIVMMLAAVVSFFVRKKEK